MKPCYCQLIERRCWFWVSYFRDRIDRGKAEDGGGGEGGGGGGRERRERARRSDGVKEYSSDQSKGVGAHVFQVRWSNKELRRFI